MISADFWKGKTVFLTGHTGFKGGWLSLWLQRLGARTIGYSLPPPTSPSLYEVAKVGDGMTSILGDIREIDGLRKAIAAHRPDIVIHMAAQSLVHYSYDNPVETYATNVLGTVNVLEAVRTVGGVRALISVTSDKCYENQEWLWGYREIEPMGGYDPYSSSKGCAELVTAAYRRSFFSGGEPTTPATAVASVRAGNVIGGGDWAKDRLMTDMIAALMSGRPAIIRNPMAIRPWQHVLEPLRGYLMLAERLWSEGSAFASGWNFGPDDESVTPVGWIADWLVSQWGAGAVWQRDDRRHPHEARQLKLDCSKAKALLGWTPAWTIEDALGRILAWWRAYLAKEDMRQLCWSQIADYEASAAQSSRA